MALLPYLSGAGDDRGDAVKVAGRRLSSEELLGCVNAVADRIHGASAVAVEAVPSLEALVAVVGALRAGVPVVPLPPAAGERERNRILRESKAAFVLGTSTTRRPSCRLPLLPIQLHQRSATHYPEPKADQDAVILYTGGTSGRPQGVRLSRRAIAADLDLLADAWGWTNQDVVVHGLPLFRAYGLIVGVLGALRVGSRLVHLDQRAHEGAPAASGTMYLAVPARWSRISDDRRWARSLSTARVLVSADAPLPATVFERLRLTTSHKLIEGYGTTETLIVVTGRADSPRRPGLAGIPLCGVETRLLDENHRPVPADGKTVGELSVRAPTLFSGYLNQDEGAAGGAGGWCPTGDIATIAADGSHRIIGRRRTDVVSTGTRRVEAAEVEALLLTHPGVLEAAVVGTPHARWGQQVTAYVVATGGVTAQALIDHIGRYLSAHHRPRRVHFVDRLPRSALGRVRKSLLIGHR